MLDWWRRLRVDMLIRSVQCLHDGSAPRCLECCITEVGPALYGDVAPPPVMPHRPAAESRRPDGRTADPGRP
jgi:hypothetical protein